MVDESMGIIGLGVMGRNLALNLAEKGYGVTAYDPWPQARDQFAAQLEAGSSDQITLAHTLADLLQDLPRPRSILIMVKAGEPVDQIITELKPILSSGDVLIDGGNSYFRDTIRRERALRQSGIDFIGLGISGGEEGARNGPSLMAGSSKKAWGKAGSVLEAIAAKYDGTACCARLGSDGAGHFVKTVHNGIEYGIMQLLAEAYHIMRDVLRMDHPHMAATFERWNSTELASYLIEITSNILTAKDSIADGPLVEAILDKAGQKGTGRWSSESALEFDSPATTIAEAGFARAMASAKEERITASSILAGPAETESEIDRNEALQHLHEAVLCGFISTFAQGLVLIQTGAHEQKWQIDLAEVCSVWRNGCVIRAAILDDMTQAYRVEAEPQNLICAPFFSQKLKEAQRGWRETIALAIRHGVPVPGLSSALAWYDSYRSERLPANLIQAQRDYFGAHTYERVDRTGSFHTDWASLMESRS